MPTFASEVVIQIKPETLYERLKAERLAWEAAKSEDKKRR
jgi:hypothetical protein